MNPLKKLLAYGQSCWMDDLTRHMITSGELARRVADEDLWGITSNPAIFEKAITGGGEYDSDIAHLAAPRPRSTKSWSPRIFATRATFCARYTINRKARTAMSAWKFPPLGARHTGLNR
jgi:transaldolase